MILMFDILFEMDNMSGMVAAIMFV